MDKSRSTLWLPSLWGALCAVGLSVPALVLNGWERSLEAETRFTPWVAGLRGAAILLPSLSALVVGFLVARRAWPFARALRPGWRFGWLAGVVLIQGALMLTAVVTGVLTQRHWLFGEGTPYLSVPSPDGRRTAFATRECFLGCNLEIHVQEGRGWTMKRLQLIPSVDSSEVEVVWLPDSSNVEVRNLKPHPHVGPYLGPH